MRNLFFAAFALLHGYAQIGYGQTVVSSCTMDLLHTSGNECVVDTMAVVDSAVAIRLSTEWDGAEMGILRINGVKRDALVSKGEKDFDLRLPSDSAGVYECELDLGKKVYRKTIRTLGTRKIAFSNGETSLDTMPQPRIMDAAGEDLVYDASWFEGGATAKIADNGAEIASGARGTHGWIPASCGLHNLTLAGLNGNGQIAGSESAGFTVPHTEPVACARIEPTFDTDGREAGTKCARCGEYLSGGATIPRLQREFNTVATGYAGIYDGLAHGAEFSVAGVNGVVRRYAVTGATDSVPVGNWSGTAPLMSNAGTYRVWCEISAPGYVTQTNSAVVSIARRQITLSAKSKEKTYDGLPLAVAEGDIVVGGDGYAPGEKFEYFGFSSITEVGETAAEFKFRDSSTAKTANYAVTVVGGAVLKITVPADKILVVSDSMTWAYDGGVHEAKSWTVVNGEALPAGLELEIKIADASAISTPKDGPDGNGLVTNAFESVRIVDSATREDKTSNYRLEIVEGVLRMTNACITAEHLTGADDVAKTYDGSETNVVVSAELLQPAAVLYGKTEEEIGATEPESFRNATNAVVWYAIEAEFYHAVTGKVEVAIAKRQVSLRSPDKQKEYDGAALTFAADEIAVGGDGFADSEGVEYSAFASRTDAGTSRAAFAYAAAGATDLRNYDIAVQNGLLTVAKARNEWTTEPFIAGWNYGSPANVPAGAAKFGEVRFEYLPRAVGLPGNYAMTATVADTANYGGLSKTVSFAIVQADGITGDGSEPGSGTVPAGGLSKFDAAAVYDGEAHTIATNELEEAFRALEAGVGELRIEYGYNDAGTMPADGEWSSDAPLFTDAGEYLVWYRVTNANNENYVRWAKLTIEPPPTVAVTLEAMGGRIGTAAKQTLEMSGGVYGGLPRPVREGCVFMGWFDGVGAGATEAKDGDDLLSDMPHALYARWENDPAVCDASLFAWEDVDADTVAITGFRNPGQQIDRLVIPDAINGKLVVAIRPLAFANSKSGMRELYLPTFCLHVGDKAFLSVPTLRKIEFAPVRDWMNPASEAAALTIGEYAFAGATGLEELYLGEKVGAMLDYAFLNARNLAKVTILGKPEFGKQVFRSAGMDAGGVTVHLSPDHANDATYLATVKENMHNVAVKTDAVVRSVRTSALARSAKSVRLSVSVEQASSWGEVDASRLRVEYRETLNSPPVMLAPKASRTEGGFVLEVEPPEASSGFFKIIVAE